MRILIVEDHPKLRANLVKLFRGAGYFVDQAIHGLEAMEKIQQQSFDLLILDMNLPIFNGTEVLQKLRSKENPIPILVLTSNNFPGDIVKVLDMGADDYLTKPFDIDQLFARVRAILRRNTAILPQQIVDIGVLKIDISYHEVFFEWKPLPLPAKELGILIYLAEHHGQHLRKEDIYHEVWGEHEDYLSQQTKTVEMCISRLNKRFGKKIIQSTRNLWYTLIHG